MFQRSTASRVQLHIIAVAFYLISIAQGSRLEGLVTGRGLIGYNIPQRRVVTIGRQHDFATHVFRLASPLAAIGCSR